MTLSPIKNTLEREPSVIYPSLSTNKTSYTCFCFISRFVRVRKSVLMYFTPGFFDRCTYMVEGKQTGEVSLVTPDGTPYVTVDFDAPLFAIWSPEGKNAPFVCIEPWYGRCDEVGFAGSLEERAYGNTLQAGEVFEKSYSIRYL